VLALFQNVLKDREAKRQCFARTSGRGGNNIPAIPQSRHQGCLLSTVEACARALG
jgi:hypothetical protein